MVDEPALIHHPPARRSINQASVPPAEPRSSPHDRTTVSGAGQLDMFPAEELIYIHTYVSRAGAAWSTSLLFVFFFFRPAAANKLYVLVTAARRLIASLSSCAARLLVSVRAVFGELSSSSGNWSLTRCSTLASAWTPSAPPGLLLCSRVLNTFWCLTLPPSSILLW